MNLKYRETDHYGQDCSWLYAKVIVVQLSVVIVPIKSTSSLWAPSALKY